MKTMKNENLIMSKKFFQGLILLFVMSFSSCSVAVPDSRINVSTNVVEITVTELATKVSAETAIQKSVTPTPSSSIDQTGWIVFSSRRDGEQDLYIISADGETLIKMGLSILQPRDPTWSPDWQEIAFSSKGDIYVVDVNCINLLDECINHTSNITSDDFNYIYPDWAPDGTRIAYSFNPEKSIVGPNQIGVMNETGLLKKQLTEEISAREPSWSPNNNEIAFTSSSMLTDYYLQIGLVFIVDVEEGESRLLVKPTSTMLDSFSPSWSPDGEYIAFISGSGDLDDATYLQNLYIVHPDGSGLRLLARGFLGVKHPSWSPDSSKIVYADHDGLYIIDIESLEIEQLTTSESDSSPSWSP